MEWQYRAASHLYFPAAQSDESFYGTNWKVNPPRVKVGVK